MPIRLTPDQLDRLIGRSPTPEPGASTRSPRAPSASSPPPPRERAIQRAVIDALSASGWLVLRTNAGLIPIGDRVVRLGPRGWPDLTCVSPRGQLLCLEIKRTPRQRPTRHQEAVHAELRRRGVRVETICSVDQALQVAREVEGDAAARTDPAR